MSVSPFRVQLGFLFILLSMSTGVKAQSRDCTGMSDFSDVIACLREEHRPQLQECQPPQQSSWKSPVAGKRVLDFGEKTPYQSISKGIVYDAQQGAVVHAPTAGIALFAGEFRSYGKLVILAACNVDLLLAGFDTLLVRRGDTVQAADALGRMPTAPAGGATILYFEVKAHGRAVDPRPFLE
jgi:septal ring factor EnvC (AmiA/AmiB activator)